jgi:hypothetical protein
MRRNRTRAELADLATSYALSHDLGPMVMIHFAHDDWCWLLKGGAVCNCNPEMQVSEIKDIPDGVSGHLH